MMASKLNSMFAMSVLLALALVTSACSSSGDGAGTSGDLGSDSITDIDGEITIDLGNDEIVLTAALTTFDQCSDLLDHLHDEYAARVGPWGFSPSSWFTEPMFMENDIGDDAGMADDGRRAVGVDSPSPSSVVATEERTVTVGASASAPGLDLVEGVDFSGTNVAEVGVDEADLVKTDGRRIFVVSAGELVVVDVSTRRVTGTVGILEGWSPELFIDGDEVLLIMGGAGLIGEPEWQQVTIIQRISIADATPVIVTTMGVQGSYLSSRSVAGVARVIMRHDPHLNFPFVYPQNTAGEAVAEEANRRAVLASSLEDWLPGYTTIASDGTASEGLLPDCGNVFVPSPFSGFGVTTVLNVPVAGTLQPGAAASVMVPGDIVYASPDSLYVTSTNWLEPEPLATEGQDEARAEVLWNSRRVNIHRFDISDPDRARYTASGSVPGEIHNQFSLSEYDDHLRVVTTTSDFRSGQVSESHVRVLREGPGGLVEVGSVGDIGRGERVQSVRFVADTAYVVTFRQIDPFYTIDLADPANPMVLGELKIPGFSSYLHPISDDLVLGIGSDADDSGLITGAKVSLFDVSDLANPREVAVWTAPNGWNNIGWEHRAFLWWAPQNLAVIPVTVRADDWNAAPENWTRVWSGAVVLNVENSTITEVGRIDHLDLADPVGVTNCRRLTTGDLPSPRSSDEFETELEWILIDETQTRVIVCPPGESGITGYSCWSQSWLGSEARSLGIRLGEGETVMSCYPDGRFNQILRSMVIADELWTLSYPGGWVDDPEGGWLTVNDLDSLQRLGSVELD